MKMKLRDIVRIGFKGSHQAEVIAGMRIALRQMGKRVLELEEALRLARENDAYVSGIVTFMEGKIRQDIKIREGLVAEVAALRLHVEQLKASSILPPVEQAALDALAPRLSAGTCGTCGMVILPDTMTGTTCVCAESKTVNGLNDWMNVLSKVVDKKEGK